MTNAVSSTIRRTLTGIIATTVLHANKTTATATTPKEMVAGNCVLAIHKPAGVTLAATWQGSVNLLDWVAIGAEQSASGAVNNTFPWRYIRCNVTTCTPVAKTADSVTQAAGTATFTEVGHGFVAGEYVTIAGANQSGYNGLKLILTADADTFTFAVDAATVTPATGTVTATPNATFWISE